MDIGFPKKIPVPIDQSCIGYWKFDEQTGTLKDYSGNGNNGTPYSTNLNDISGNGNHGIITNATRVTGKIGQALSFDGSTTYVDCGNAASISNLNALFTVEFWIKPNNVTTRQTIIGHENETNIWQIEIGNNPNPPTPTACVAVIIPGWSQFATGSNVLTAGLWHHIVITINGGASGSCTIYVNGASQSLTQNGSISNINITSHTYLGRRAAGTQLYNGLLDDARIYNRVLSAGEVTSHYNSGNGLISDPATETGLVGYWRMGITDGMTVPGKFGNALKFDGIDDYVDCGNGSSLNLTNAITIETWIYPLVDTRSGIVSRGYLSFPGTRSPELIYGYVSQKISWFLSHDGGGASFVELNSLSNVPINNWTYIAVTFDGTSSKIYLNGILDNSLNDPGAIFESSRTWWIGRLRRDDNSFNGTLDNVYIWNRILTPQEIKRHYMAGR